MMRRLYESTFIINAALEDNDVDAVVNKVTSYIENQGGEIKTVEKWGRRRLAYPINKKYNGFYIHIEFEALPNAVPVIERFFVLEDTVLRHLTLVLPQSLKDYRLEQAMKAGKEEAAEEVVANAKANEKVAEEAKPIVETPAETIAEETIEEITDESTQNEEVVENIEDND